MVADQKWYRQIRYFFSSFQKTHTHLWAMHIVSIAYYTAQQFSLHWGVSKLSGFQKSHQTPVLQKSLKRLMKKNYTSSSNRYSHLYFFLQYARSYIHKMRQTRNVFPMFHHNPNDNTWYCFVHHAHWQKSVDRCSLPSN